MKAIILARVSSKEQEDNNSIPAQTRRLVDYAERKELEVIETIQLVESSTKTNRVKFNEVISRIKSTRETIALVTDTIDRLQRDFRESVTLDELRRKGLLELHFMREGLIINQGSNSADILRWDMGVMFAKSYVTQLSYNVKRSQEQKIKDGEWICKAPFGYANVELSGKKWIEPDANAEIVRDMFDWYASGAFSMQQVRSKLAEEHGLRKSLSQVDKILKNPFYAGVMRIKGEECAHRYTPLITRPLYDSAQRMASRYKKQPFKYAGLPYLYRGVISCGTCGCRITPERSKGHVYYHCTQYKGKHGAPYIREEDLTDQLCEVFNAIKPTQKQYDLVLDALQDAHANNIANKKNQLSRLQAELQMIEGRMSRLYDSYLDGDITKEIYKAKNRDMKTQKMSIDQKLSSLDAASEEYYDSGVRIMELVRNASKIFQSSEMEEKRQLLQFVLQNLELHDRQLRWKYKKPYDSMASYKNDSTWLGWRDSNPRMLVPETSALPLGDTPSLVTNCNI